jgi:hypothetical protein
MVNKETKTKRDRQYNGQQRDKDEERQTIQWSTKEQRRRETDNTMVIKETKRDREYNGQQRQRRRETDNTMVNKETKTKRDRQYNGHQRDGQAMIHKTLPVKVKIEQHHAH